MEEKSHLLLEDQLCFPIYAASRMVTRLYQPLLSELDLTYPQYLVMLVLWEDKRLTIGELGKKLYLNTNTLTPLLKKMKEKGLLKKERSPNDERIIYVELTRKGSALKQRATSIPQALVKDLDLPAADIRQMRSVLWKFLKTLT